MILNSTVNTFKSKIEETKINDEAYFIFIHNPTLITENIHKSMRRRYIQFYFCTQGNVKLNFDKRNYQIPLTHNKSFLLYHPVNELPINLNISEKSKVFIWLTTVDFFHSIFIKTGQEILFLNNENIANKFYKEFPITDNLHAILEDCEKYQLNENFKSVFYQAKMTELLVNFFCEPEQPPRMQCPFLNNEKAVLKIKQVKDILIENMEDPPQIKTLSEQVNLSEYKLKQGFKKIYGATPSAYLLNYKLEKSKKMLRQDKMSVQEVACKIGYDNPSHFISAFKKKYNITPKKYST